MQGFLLTNTITLYSLPSRLIKYAQVQTIHKIHSRSYTSQHQMKRSRVVFSTNFLTQKCILTLT